MFKFKPEDLLKYKKADPGFGPVGLMTYKRTYSRPIYENESENAVVKRREEWLETIVRVIEGSVNLGISIKDPTATREWALEALEYMFHMSAMPPGRGYWMMGTDYAKLRGGDALNNCWYTAVRPQSYENMDMFKDTYVFSDPIKAMPSFPFVFMFDRAMLGGGVGFGIGRNNINRYPKLTTKVDLKIVLDKDHPDWERIKGSEEYNTLPGLYQVLTSESDSSYTTIRATDDREGWGVAVREVIDAHWLGDTWVGQVDSIKLCIDLSGIREYGAPIKGFGGTASGPLPLIAALQSINLILNKRVGRKMNSVDALDMMNLLGRCVVAGNVRRTALIGIGDADDKEYVEAKNYTLTLPIMEKTPEGYTIWAENEWGRMAPIRRKRDEVIAEFYQEERSKLSSLPDADTDFVALQKATERADYLFDVAWKQDNHRWASNNSVYTNKMFKDHHFIASGIIANGEPGVGNEWLMKNFGRIKDGYQEAIDADAEGLNPCAEVTLENVEPCNLVEFVPYRAKQYGHDFKRVITICTQYVYRITFAKYLWPATQRVIEKNRRIGVSLTGMQDYFLNTYDRYALDGFEKDEHGKDDITKPIFYQPIVDELDTWYGWVVEVNKEQASLMGANVSIKKTTCKPSGTVAKMPGVSSGIHWHYSPYMIQRIRFNETDPNLLVVKACGFPIEKAAKEPNTVVVEFPVKNPNADNPNFKSSADVSLEEQFANQYLFAYIWADNAVSATLSFQQQETDKIEPLLAAYNNRIKSTSLLPYQGHGYVQAPWEPITKEEYEERVSTLQLSVEEAYAILASSVTGDSELLDSDCIGGACPPK